MKIEPGRFVVTMQALAKSNKVEDRVKQLYTPDGDGEMVDNVLLVRMLGNLQRGSQMAEAPVAMTTKDIKEYLTKQNAHLK